MNTDQCHLINNQTQVWTTLCNKSVDTNHCVIPEVRSLNASLMQEHIKVFVTERLRRLYSDHNQSTM